MERYFSTWDSYPYHFVSEDVRERYHRIVTTPRKAVVLTELRAIIGEFYDVNQLDCVPRSKYRPEMLLKPCRKFESGGKMPAVHWNDLKRAVQNVKSMLVRKQKVRPLDLSEVPFDASKNSGLPFLAKKADVYDVSLKLARECELGKCPPPMAMFSRGKNLEVARPVMAGPFEWQLLEGKFFYPLQELLLSFDNPYLVGRHSCVTGAKLQALTYDPYVLCMDYSGFDGSLSAVLINSSFAILRRMLELNDAEAGQWKAIVSYFLTSPILCPDLRVYHGRRHGVPSGSMFTQMIDSICNMIIIEYISERLHLRLGKMYVVGDDSVVAVDSVDIDAVVRTALEIGITVSPDKTVVVDTSKTRTIHFLGHDWRDGLASRPVENTLEKLLAPERLRKEMFSKDAHVRREYYRERIRAYQEDNVSSEAWRLLRLVEMRLVWPDKGYGILKLQAVGDATRHYFAGAEIVERDRWDQNRRQLRSDAMRQWFRPAVFWA